MKIFSLQTKKHLVIWAFLVALILNLILLRLSFINRFESICPQTGPINCFGFILVKHNYGWPFVLVEKGNHSTISNINDSYYFINYENFFYNLVFYCLITLIILSLIRYLKYKRQITK